jgi:hypothetical protein
MFSPYSLFHSDGIGLQTNWASFQTRQQLIDEKLALEKKLEAALEAARASDSEKRALEDINSGLNKELANVMAERCALEKTAASLAQERKLSAASPELETRALAWFKKVKASLPDNKSTGTAKSKSQPTDNILPALKSEVDKIIKKLGAQVDKKEQAQPDLAKEIVKCLETLTSNPKFLPPDFVTSESLIVSYRLLSNLSPQGSDKPQQGKLSFPQGSSFSMQQQEEGKSKTLLKAALVQLKSEKTSSKKKLSDLVEKLLVAAAELTDSTYSSSVKDKVDMQEASGLPNKAQAILDTLQLKPDHLYKDGTSPELARAATALTTIVEITKSLAELVENPDASPAGVAMGGVSADNIPADGSAVLPS